MPCSRQSSGTGVPASDCFRIAMIWLSVNFDFFMQNLLRIGYEKILLLTSVIFRGDYRLTHTLVTTAANEHDLNQLKNLLHGEEEFASGDAGYQGAEKREELQDTNVEWLIAERPGKVRALKKHPRKNKTAINIEYLKASIRAKVEHPFRIIKCQFGFIKARYKGLMKNDSQLAMLCTLANLFKVDQMLRRQPRSV
ncbi:transposase [Alteromonas oceani]